ncbi:hypothetical protein ACJX0J_036359, partial [Zea mays]
EVEMEGTPILVVVSRFSAVASLFGFYPKIQKLMDIPMWEDSWNLIYPFQDRLPEKEEIVQKESRTTLIDLGRCTTFDHLRKSSLEDIYFMTAIDRSYKTLNVDIPLFGVRPIVRKEIPSSLGLPYASIIFYTCPKSTSQPNLLWRINKCSWLRSPLANYIYVIFLIFLMIDATAIEEDGPIQMKIFIQSHGFHQHN